MAENTYSRQKASGKYALRKGTLVRKKSAPYSPNYR